MSGDWQKALVRIWSDGVAYGVRIMFIGTGSGIYDPFEEDYRAFTSVLVQDLLIDTPVMVLTRMKDLGLSLGRVHTVLYTHAHSDHYHEGVLRQLVEKAPVGCVAAASGLASKISDVVSGAGGERKPTVLALSPYETVMLGKVEVTPLIANHTSIRGDPTLNFLLQYGETRLLYFVDSSVPLHRTVKFLEELARPADALLMDATTVMSQSHEHMCAHGNLPQVARVAAAWREMGILKPDARVYGMHLSSRSMADRAPTQAELAGMGIDVAEDGTRLIV